ncbi:MAG TPA: STM3941 family protein [Mucilaginibacter sp.]|jgi:hypothetical protein|nr:STM3941 family protein [Mucilaginibacter sp.]
MIEIKLYKSPWKAVRLILLSLPFVIAGFYFLVKGDADKTMDWVCICFFGLGIPLGLFNLLDKRPQIIMSETGIYDRMGYKDTLEWDWIKNAYLKDVKTSNRGWIVSKQTFIYLVIEPYALPLLKGNTTLRKVIKDLGFPEVAISLNPLQKIDGQKLVDFIKAMSTADISARQNLLLKSEL